MSEQYTFFWSGPFSQWHPSEFTLHGKVFNCAEQYMMWRKAELFGDEETADLIMKAKTPKVQKQLGRRVSDFDSYIWDQCCKTIVYDANHAKFSQNPELYERLLATGCTKMVEASPYDAIWGIGLEEDEARATPEELWPGSNYLGEILTKLREDFRSVNYTPQ